MIPTLLKIKHEMLVLVENGMFFSDEIWVLILKQKRIMQIKSIISYLLYKNIKYYILWFFLSTFFNKKTIALNHILWDSGVGSFVRKVLRSFTM